LTSSIEELLLRLFPGFTDLLHHEALRPAKFLLEARREIVRAVFKKNDETKSEEDKEDDPK
jgi:hypothetical protein